MSLFLLYLQIFWPKLWLRLSIYFGFAFTCIFYGAILIATFIWTIPTGNETWLGLVTGPELPRLYKLAIPNSAVGLGIDCFLLLLPTIAMAPLQMPLRRKIGALLVFMTGLL